MNKRPIDKTKKSNIKCEHCKYWQGINSGNHWGNYNDCMGCTNANSRRYEQVTNYWNRCKHFEWAK